MSHSSTAAHDGQAIYTRPGLAIYDLFVVRFSNRFIWRCPWSRQLAVYDAHVSANHLDVGVGTGFYLDYCRFPVTNPRLALLDANPNLLDASAARLARYRPERYRADVLEPVDINAPRFDSMA